MQTREQFSAAFEADLKGIHDARDAKIDAIHRNLMRDLDILAFVGLGLPLAAILMVLGVFAYCVGTGNVR